MTKRRIGFTPLRVLLWNFSIYNTRPFAIVVQLPKSIWKKIKTSANRYRRLVKRGAASMFNSQHP
jgi:hypothetical protein